MRIKLFLLIASLVALVVVPAAMAMRFTDASRLPPTGYVGHAYTHKFEILAGGGCPPYTYKVLNGTFPPGLSLASSDGGPGVKGGDVTGTPTTVGIYTFYLEATDTQSVFCNNVGSPPSRTQEQFTIRIQPGLNIVQQGLDPNHAVVNQPYSYQLLNDQPSTPVTWSVISGSLPPGINLNATNGTVSGTPTAVGDYTFKIQVSDGNRSDAETYTLAVVDALVAAAVPIGARSGEVGHPYSLDLNASGGRQPYVWTSPTPLPAGLVLDQATGVISGTPTAPSATPLVVTLTDSVGTTTNVNVGLRISPKLTLTKRPLLPARTKRLYSAQVTKLGGVAPFRWRVLTGKLPAGIKLGARTGQLSGIPLRAGSYRFRLMVTDRLGVRTSQSYVLKVVG